MGTPGYMAPEQARGEPVGPAADVFSLGATLFTLLTDRAPGEPGAPRPATPALLAVAARAMAARAEERYPSAPAVADDVARWLADEPVSAYRDPPLARLGRWARRNRSLVRAGAAAVLVCVVVLAVAAVLLKWSGDRERVAAELATQRKAEAEENYRQARRAVDEFYVSVSEGRLKTLPGAQPYRKELLQTALRYYREFLAAHADDPANKADIAATYTRVAMIVGEVESAAEAVGWHERAVNAWRELDAADPDRADYRRELGGALDRYGLHLSRAGRPDDALRAQEEAVGLLDSLHAADAGDVPAAEFLYRALVNLSSTQGKAGRNADAVRTGGRGLALGEELIRRRPGDLVHRRNVGALLMNLGLDLADLGRSDEGVGPLERSVRVLDDLCAELDAHPERAAAVADAISNPRNGLAQA